MNSNSKFSTVTAFIHALLFAVILSGCGGGESSKTSMENDLPSPVAGGIDGEVLVPVPTGASPIPTITLDWLPQISAGPRQYADPNVLLNLRGTAVAATGAQIVKTLWTQVTGPDVIIPSPQSLENVVVIPDVNLATQLEFRLTAQDSEGRMNSATIAILVKPVPTFVKVVGGVFNEADERAVFKIRLNAPSTTPVTVSYITQDGSAYSGVSDVREEVLDYVAASGEVVFAAGEVLKDISVDLINDTYEEGDETFSLQVTAIDGTATHANSGVAIIHDGVAPVPPQELQFNDAGPVNLYVGEERSNAVSPEDFEVIYSSSNSSVAYVTSSGVVAGMSVGTATITAIKPVSDIYGVATGSYTVNVISRGTAPSVKIVRTVSPTTFEPNTTVGDTGTFSNDAAGVLTYKAGSALANLAIGQSVIENFTVVTVEGLAFSIEVTVTGSSTGPVAVIEDFGAVESVTTGADADGYSVHMGESVQLTGRASDEEDGQIPTEAQPNQSVAISEAIESLSWSSSIDGPLNYGDSLDTNTLTQGTHIISYSVTDSDGNTSVATTRVLVGNIAPSAYYTDASSTYCSDEMSDLHCYSSYRVNDTSLSTELGGAQSWVNNNITETKLPQWVSLSWGNEATVNGVDIYTTEGYILRDYDIEYYDGESWQTLVSVTDNTEVHRSHATSTVTTYDLRVVAKEGSLLQPQHARINEIVVFGTTSLFSGEGG